GGRGVGQGGWDPDLVLAGLLLGVHAGASQERMHALLADGLALDLAGGDAPRDLARQAAELALELADARLARVARDDLADRVVGQRQLLRAEAVLLDLAGHQVALRGLTLLLLVVAPDVDDLPPL